MIAFEDNQPHEVSELICLKCLHRWIGVYPSKTLLKDLECRCGAVGYVIKTGQTIEEETDKECKICKLYIKNKCKLGLHSSEKYYCGYYKQKVKEQDDSATNHN